MSRSGKSSTDVVALFPPTPQRLHSVTDVLSGKERAERYLFYGLEYLFEQGVDCIHNISPHNSRFARLIATLHRAIFSRIFISYGEIEWILPVMKNICTARLLYVFSERLILPIIYYRMLGILPRCPTVFIPIGLSEKLNMMYSRRPRLTELCLNELKKIDLIVPLSQELQNDLCDTYGFQENVKFLPAGVDTQYFHPGIISAMDSINVLSIGADKYRDFTTLLKAARELPSVTFKIITTRKMADKFDPLPKNVVLFLDIPMMQIRGHLTSCSLLALPVMKNNYSGATTVLLQAMAMGKPVIANRVGANKEGYGFIDGKNVIFIPENDAGILTKTIRKYLAEPEKLTSIGSAARETVEKHLSLDSFNREIFTLLDEIYKRHYKTSLQKRTC